MNWLKFLTVIIALAACPAIGGLSPFENNPVFDSVARSDATLESNTSPNAHDVWLAESGADASADDSDDADSSVYCATNASLVYSLASFSGRNFAGQWIISWAAIRAPPFLS